MDAPEVRPPVVSEPPMKHPLRALALVALFALVFGAAYMRLPYYAEGPGPAREVQPMIDVGGEPRYDSAGKLIMTTVSWYPVTAAAGAPRLVGPEPEGRGRGLRLYPPGIDRAAEEQRSRSEMDQSKIDATMVVLARARGLPEGPWSRGPDRGDRTDLPRLQPFVLRATSSSRSREIRSPRAAQAAARDRCGSRRRAGRLHGARRRARPTTSR